MRDPEDDEPEVEDVESVRHGLLPPAKHVHDYGRVHDLLRRWRPADGGGDGDGDGDVSEPASEEDFEKDSDASSDDRDVSNQAPASAKDTKPKRPVSTRLSLPPAGLSNSGNTCFAAAALQCLHRTALLTAHFADEPHCVEMCRGSRTSANSFCVTCEYQELVIRSLHSKPGERQTIGKLTSSIGKIAKHFVRGRQEDSHEYIRSVLDAMHVGWLTEFAGPQAEKVLDPRTQETTMIYHVFGGYTVGRVVCGGCGHESRTYQAVLDLPIEVTVGHRQHVSSVTAALRRNFCDTETLDGANKYKCGGCHAYVTAEKGSKIHVSPNVLVVPVKRYASGRGGKITKFVEYPLRLDLSEYMSADAPNEGNALPKYTLFGLVVHLDFMGSTHSGHYVAFVRLASGVWCKCDDGSVRAFPNHHVPPLRLPILVTKTTEKEALAQKAYLFFYERDVARDAGPVRTSAQQRRMEGLLALDKARTERIADRKKRLLAVGDTEKVARVARNTVCPYQKSAPAFVVTTKGVQKGFGVANGSDDSGEIDSNDDSDSDGDSDDSDDSKYIKTTGTRTPWPCTITVTIAVPSVTSAKQLVVEMTDSSIAVGVKKIHLQAVGDAFLEMPLPFPVDDDDAQVVFESAQRSLVIVAPVKKYTKKLAREHAFFLKREQRRLPKTARLETNADCVSNVSNAPGSSVDSEWEDDDAQQGSASDTETDGITDGMGLMGIGTSPTTRAKRRAEGTA